VLLIVNLIVLYFTISIGVMAIAIGITIVEYIGSTVIFILAHKYYHYKMSDRLKDVFKPLLFSLIMCLAMYFVEQINLNNLYVVISQIIVGILVYFGLSYFSRNDNLFYIINMIKNRIS